MDVQLNALMRLLDMTIMYFFVQSNITKILKSKKIQNGKSIINCKVKKLKHIKLNENNCHIPDLLVQVFPYVENVVYNLVLYLTPHLYDSLIKFHYIYYNVW